MEDCKAVVREYDLATKELMRQLQRQRLRLRHVQIAAGRRRVTRETEEDGLRLDDFPEHQLRVRRAPAPSDIIWPDLAASGLERRVRQVASSGILF